MNVDLKVQFEEFIGDASFHLNQEDVVSLRSMFEYAFYAGVKGALMVVDSGSDISAGRLELDQQLGDWMIKRMFSKEGL